MNFAKLVADGLRHHRRIHVAVGLGVAAATAVLTGALLVGDSVRGSLRFLTTDRLGHIDEILVAERFFGEDLAERILRQPGFAEHFAAALPGILLRGTVEAPRPRNRAVAGNVSVIGCDDDFWRLGSSLPPVGMADHGIVLNQPLADELQVKSGDDVILRLPAPSQIPADSPLGRKSETVRSRRLKVSAVVSATGLGRFGLRPNQQLPKNAYVTRELLQEALEQAGRVNAVFVAGKENADALPPREAHEALSSNFRPTLDDYGLKLEWVEQGYVNFTSDRMMLDPPTVEAAMTAWGDLNPQPVMVYLANSITKGDRTVPYSILAALDVRSEAPLGPFQTPDGEVIPPWSDDEIVINTWTAEQLGAAVGDTIELRYFEPESTHGEVGEREPPARFRLKAIVAMEGAAADRHFAPELPGVTDQASIDDWNPPFPFDGSRVHEVDEKYWDDYRTTPKAFVTLAAGRKLFGSRFGDTTSFRIAPPSGVSVESLAARFQPHPERLGLAFQPVKRQGLEAAAGTTPFDGLFLAFSMFIIASAVMLVALLFRLGVEQRAGELGILAAVGWRASKARRLFLAEGAIVAALGGLLGVALGVGYAWLMLAGLRTWWLAAISTPFLELYVTLQSMVIGWLAGFFISLMAIGFSLRGIRRVSIRQLMAGVAVPPASITRQGRAVWRLLPGLSIVIALFVIIFDPTAFENPATFFFAGAVILVAGLMFVHLSLRRPAATAQSFASLSGLAWRNGARNALRSTLTIGLTASATFLIVAVGAFQLAPSLSGAAGFRLLAECDQPIFADLNTTAGREALAFPANSDEVLHDTRFVPLKVQSGDDASCLNLYRPTRPRILGIDPARMGEEIRGTERKNLAGLWAAIMPGRPNDKNAWTVLDLDVRSEDSGPPRVPVVLDAATAMYSLHLSGIGATYDVTDEQGDPLRLVVVGLLQNSIFQGDILMSQQEFQRHFPSVSGYNLFLIDVPRQSQEAVQSLLEDTLSDYGFDVEDTAKRLADLMAVQNTYLQTFQSLGALGLLLGTFGLATVQLRSVLERRGELALLRATGFRRWRLASLVMLENASLLLAGLVIGVVAALVAIAPQLFGGRAALPWLFLGGTLALVLITGLSAGAVAARAALRAPLLPALRGD